MASGTVRRTGRAATRGAAKVVAARPVQVALKFVSESRPVILGATREVASFTRAELVDLSASIARTRLDQLYVNFAGGATRADHVLAAIGIPDDEVEGLLAQTVADLADESARLAGLESRRPADLAALLGADTRGSSNPVMLSAGERVQCLVEGIVTIAGQARIQGIDPNDLFRPPLLSATVKYLRSHIMRNGWDHGNWSELLRSAAFARLPLVLPAVHQVQLPKLQPPFSLGFGYDTVLRRPDLVVGHQNKAVRFARVAMGGSLTPHFIGTRIDSVHGAEILRQKVSDGIRNLSWNHQLPGVTIGPPWPNTVPANTSGWDPVSPISLWAIDSPYIVDSAYELTANAVYRAGKTVVPISETDLPAPLKTQLRAMVGPPYQLVWDIPLRRRLRPTGHFVARHGHPDLGGRPQ